MNHEDSLNFLLQILNLWYIIQNAVNSSPIQRQIHKMHHNPNLHKKGDKIGLQLLPMTSTVLLNISYT
jgi:hypothetical protein